MTSEERMAKLEGRIADLERRIVDLDRGVPGLFQSVGVVMRRLDWGNFAPLSRERLLQKKGWFECT